MLFVKGMVNSNSAQGKEQRNGRPAEPGRVRDSGQRLHPADPSSISRSAHPVDAARLLANARL
jgi:hypothetical protein